MDTQVWIIFVIIQCTIRCDDIELAGNIVQAIADFFGVHHLASSAHFPHEIETLNALIEKVIVMVYLDKY